MNKKLVFLIFLIIGIVSFVSAKDRIFFDFNYGVLVYPGFGGKIGYEHYWNNEKIGFIADVNYHNSGDNYFGLAAGIVFNNMGFNGVLRTSEYIKLKGVFATRKVNSNYFIAPNVDFGFNLDVFFAEKISFFAGFGYEMRLMFLPHLYTSTGMRITL